MIQDSLNKIINLTNDKVFYTIQGEGKYTGVSSIFIRLSGCNLRCQWKECDNMGNETFTPCDTSYSSHFPEYNPTSILSIVEQCKKYPASHIVLTGGEPFLQKNIDRLIKLLVDLGKHVTVETNGTIYRSTQMSFASISPKLSSSCIITSKYFKIHNKIRINLESLCNFISNYSHQLKFVVNTQEDISEIDCLISNLKMKNGGYYDESNIYLMPQGITTEQLDSKLPWIIEAAKQRSWNVSDRLHIRLWGQQRGI